MSAAILTVQLSNKKPSCR